MEIDYEAPDSVRAVVERLGRTEDIRFSPDNRRLAIAAFNRQAVAVLDVEIAERSGTRRVILTGAVEIFSTSLTLPHGLDFVDDQTLVVANRNGDVAFFRLPSAGQHRCELSPIQVLPAGNDSLVSSPGSVSVVGRDGGARELLVCNNAGHSVTRHSMERGGGSARSGKLLLKKWLNLPDGLCVSSDRQWIAVSNHNTHGVLLYQWSPSLDESASPDGALRGGYFPHGLRFSPDGRYLFMADAGAPFVHIYANAGESWRGARQPAASVRVMDEPLFLRGRQNPQEGGPKGLDIDRGMNVLVITSEHQPLAFFDLPPILESLPPMPPVADIEYEFGILQQAGRLRARAEEAEARAAKAEAKLRKRKSRWLPAPLRRVFSASRRPN
jgi:hypothetical protein